MKNKILTGVLALFLMLTAIGWVMTVNDNKEMSDTVQEQQDDIKKKSTEIANLKNVIVKKDTDLESQKVVIDEQDSQINELSEENAIVEEENSVLKSHKEQLQNEIGTLKTKNSHLNDELETEKSKKKVASQNLSTETDVTITKTSYPMKQETKVSTPVQKQEPKTGGKTLTVSATAYQAFCNTGCIGITATGVDVRNTIMYKGFRVIAVDPSVIPLHTVVRVTVNGQSFMAIAEDTGGAIKGNKIDILVGSTEEALNFGRQEATVQILN